ncbi:MAG: hypothetical protein JWN71_4950 [Xanthobacteraceae bacterium]|nr:hypothetical protein [Xanthobacteraceae bacterium]
MAVLVAPDAHVVEVVVVPIVVVVVVGTVGIVKVSVGMAGAGIVRIGLKPPLSISVESSGRVPPLRVLAPVVPGIDSGDAVPVEDSVLDGHVALVVLTAAVLTPMDAPDPVVVVPPPSNVEFVIDVVPALPAPIAEP